MKNMFCIISTSLLVLLAGCGAMPQTAEEFRQGVPSAFMAKVEEFTVNRSYSKVSQTFRKMAPKCLDIRIKTTSQTNTSYQVIVTKWNPTVIVTPKKTELHIQHLYERGVMKVQKMPVKGYYTMVVDITPAGKNKTKLVMYRPSMGFKVLIKGIKNWAKGKNLGCPDLTK